MSPLLKDMAGLVRTDITHIWSVIFPTARGLSDRCLKTNNGVVSEPAAPSCNKN